jgi:3-oxoacyl-[acyl-carrier-protein] synthase II
MTEGRRVVVTGIGAITPIGSSREGLWDGLRGGHSAIRQITRFDATPFRSRIAAEIADFDPTDHMEARRARRLDRFSQLAVAASGQAIGDAGLKAGDGCMDSAAVYIGSALGGVAYGEEQHSRYLALGPHGVDSTLALSVFGGAGATNVAIEFGLHGPTIGNGNSCASGAIAIGEAFRLVKAGGADVALAGGVEAPLAPLTFGAFSFIRAMSTANECPKAACCPFDVDRDGFVMGEGAAVLLLEELGHALRRGIGPFAEVLGYGTTNDAYHMTAPLPSGREAARAIELAISEAHLAAEEIGYVNAHATGTPLGDAAEAKAIRLAFGEHADRLLVSGTKGLYGHPLGASGAIEAAVTSLALARSWVPPTANLVHPDPDCDVVHVAAGGESREIHAALTNSFGFGGINASLLLGAFFS